MELKKVKSYSTLLWAVIAAVVGIILISKPNEAMEWGVRLLGIVALIIGVVQFLAFLVRTVKTEDRWQQFPPICVVAVVIGALLLLIPELWANVVTILCGVLLILLAIGQVVSFIKIRKSGMKVSWGYYIFPIFLIFSGLMVITQPVYVISRLTILLGVSLLAYGIMEIFSYFTLRSIGKREEQAPKSE